jgi:hypothetical protein
VPESERRKEPTGKSEIGHGPTRNKSHEDEVIFYVHLATHETFRGETEEHYDGGDGNNNGAANGQGIPSIGMG